MEKCCPCLFMLLNLLLILLPSSLLSVTSSTFLPPMLPRCREDERSALLEFKEGFRHPISSYYQCDTKIKPWKLDSWKVDGGIGNCCTWDGVECDSMSGHVIGLNLCCTGLHTSINSTSSLFRLVYLQRLNLAYTNFNQSLVPSAIGNFPRLLSLNLSSCEFTGQIPQQILGLTNLSSLDLSSNQGLELTRPSLGDLFQRLTKLEELHLSWVNISSSLVNVPTNLSSLRSLILSNSQLHGRVPSPMFALPNLQVLHLDSNSLSSHLPEFHWSSCLKSLSLFDNYFSGELPDSIGNLTQLLELDLSSNRFRGPIPSFANGTKLTILVLADNQLTGSIPSSLGNLFQIQLLELSLNRLTGQIPSQLSSLSHLVTLDLSYNMLNDTVQLEKLLQLKNLKVLILAFNNLTVVANPNSRRHSIELLLGLML